MGEKSNFGEADLGEPSEEKRDVELSSRSTGKDNVSTVAKRKRLNLKERNVKYGEMRAALSVRIQNERDISIVKFYWILQGFR